MIKKVVTSWQTSQCASVLEERNVLCAKEMPLLMLRRASKHDELLLQSGDGEKVMLFPGRSDSSCDCVDGRQQLIAHEE